MGSALPSPRSPAAHGRWRQEGEDPRVCEIVSVKGFESPGEMYFSTVRHNFVEKLFVGFA